MEEGFYKVFIKEKFNLVVIEDYIGVMVCVIIKSGEFVIEEKVVELDNCGFMVVMIIEGKWVVFIEIFLEMGVGGFIFFDDCVDVILICL